MAERSTNRQLSNLSFQARVWGSIGLGLGVGLWLAHCWAIVRYPIGNAAGIFQYTGWALTAGEIPYRDIWEFNSPGIILLHWGWGVVAGFTDQAFLWLTIVVSTIAMWWPQITTGRHWSLSTRFLSIGVGLWAFTAITPWDRGQREIFQGILLLLGFALLSRAIQATRVMSRRRHLVAAGMCIGVAVTLKIVVAMIVLACMGVALLGLRRWTYDRWSSLLSPALWVLGATVIPIAGVLLWLFSIGAWDSFWQTQWNYLPIHRSQVSVPIVLAMDATLPWIVLILGTITGTVAWFYRAQRPLALLMVSCTLLSTYGLYLFQGKGWTYHLHIAVPFMGVAVGLCVHTLGKTVAPWARVSLGIVVMWMVMGSTVYDHSAGLRRGEQVGLHWNYPAHQQVAALLQNEGSDADRVLVNNDEQQLLYMAKRRSATRCMYGFLCSEAHPVPELAEWGLQRARWVEANPPDWVVWNDFPYQPDRDQLPLNPKIAGWIQQNCTLRAIIVPYRVWRCSAPVGTAQVPGQPGAPVEPPKGPKHFTQI